MVFQKTIQMHTLSEESRTWGLSKFLELFRLAGLALQ